MDIQVIFEDGTTETRPAWSPCLCGMFDPPSRHPSEEQRYLYLPEDRHPLSFCGISVWSLADVRGWTATVWHITGGRGENEPLTGEWQSCRVEAAHEQIERLTQERDAAIARAEEAEVQRDDQRVALIDILSLWGWGPDNGGFVSVHHLGQQALSCCVADRITFDDMLSDERTWRDRVRADQEPKPTVSLVADNERMRRRLRAVATNETRHEEGLARLTRERDEARALARAWEDVYRTLQAYRKHSFSAEWGAYEAALTKLTAVGGPNLREEHGRWGSISGATNCISVKTPCRRSESW